MDERGTVYKILAKEEWERIQETGECRLVPVDEASGFVHLATGAQLLETCQRHFKEEQEPLAVEVALSVLGTELRWERGSTRNNQEFPHLYRKLRISDFKALQYLEFENGKWTLGKRLPID